MSQGNRVFTAGSAAKAPKISVVIPIKGHPVLLDDAIASVQREMHTGAIQRLIAVNDGCNYAETRESLAGWRAILGDSIWVLHCSNGGLSAARNRGIDAALKADPDLEAIFLLDADNMLAPDAGAAMCRLINTSPQADWFYPDFDFFGQSGHYITDRQHELLFHAHINVCEAGSLIRRRVIDAGIRFDEAMKRGYEDWDFWLSAARAGFRGQAAARPLLLYRKRPVSMLSNSHDVDPELRSYLEQKHTWLFNTPKLLELEAERFPRFAVIEGEASTVRLQTDPGQDREITLRELERQIMAHFAEPFANHAPAYLVFLRDGVSARLNEYRLLHSFFWNAERRWVRSEDRPHFDLFYLAPSQSGHTISTDYNTDQLADGVVIDLKAVHDLVTASGEEALRRIDQVPSGFRVRGWAMALDRMTKLNRRAASGPELLRNFILQLSRSPFRAALNQRWEWREKGGAVDRSTAVQIPRKISSGGVVLPLLKKRGQRDIAFVLPIFDFGGVEKAAASVARELAKNGYRCHLVVVSDRPIRLDGWALQAFATVNWMPDASAIDWTGAEFLGTAEPSWGNCHEKADLIGLLSSMDVVINAHSGALHKVADFLRRRGTIMIDHEHLLERSTYGRNYGPPKLALAYEYAYDLILTCSESLRIWMHGHGIPREKLMAVINGPGYPLPSSIAQRVVDERAKRDPAEPLRVLFMGRLDPQKGVHRLSAIYHALAQRTPHISLTIAGGSVVSAETAELSFPRETRMLGAVRGSEELTRVLAAADVMVLPSHYEGLPLSVLEAQRCGVVVLATDVGSMDEAIQHGRTGFILPESGCEESFFQLITTLDKDRTLLARVSQNAASMARDWSSSVAPLLAWLERREGGMAAEENGMERFYNVQELT